MEEQSPASKKQRSAAATADQLSCAMEVQPGRPLTQMEAGDSADGEAAGSQLQPGGDGDAGGNLLTAVAPALFELLTRLLLADRSIRDSWH